jgi:hypothetical protein
MKPAARTFAFALSASMLMTGAITLSAHAQSLQTYVLENVRTQSVDKSGEVFIPRIEVVGSTASAGDIQRLLTPDLSAAARAELVMNLQAQRITIPEVIVTYTDKTKGRFVLRDYVVSNLDRARFDRISLGGINGVISGTGNGDGSLTSGPIVLEGGDFSKLAAAAKSGSAIDGTGKLRLFTWSDFSISMPDEKLPASAPGGNMYRFAIKSVRAVTDYAGDIPTKATANFSGLSFDAPASSTIGQSLAAFGYKRIELGLNFAGAYNPSARSFALTDYSLSGVDAGALAFAGAFADIDAATFTGDNETRQAALLRGKIANLDLRYVDSGLFERALVFYAASVGKDVLSVRKEWSMMIVGMLPILMGGDPAALKLSEALSTFVNQPKSLAISLKPKGGPIAMGDLAKLADPMALLARIEIMATANR